MGMKHFFFALFQWKLSKDGSKFWWLLWFPAKNHSPKTFKPAVYPFCADTLTFQNFQNVNENGIINFWLYEMFTETWLQKYELHKNIHWVMQPSRWISMISRKQKVFILKVRLAFCNWKKTWFAKFLLSNRKWNWYYLFYEISSDT